MQLLVQRNYESVDQVPPEKLGVYVFGTLAICFNKADSLDDLYVNKNSAYSKHEIERKFSIPMLRNSLFSMETDDPQYVKKRKALSGAFMKSKLEAIRMEVKQVALRTFAELQAQGDVNVVDLNKFTSKVQANIIVSILVGQEYCYKEIDHVDLATGELTKQTVAEAMNSMFEDFMTRISTSPEASFCPESEFFAIDKRFAENCRSTRAYFSSIIDDKKRQAGEQKKNGA